MIQLARQKMSSKIEDEIQSPDPPGALFAKEDFDDSPKATRSGNTQSNQVVPPNGDVSPPPSPPPNILPLPPPNGVCELEDDDGPEGEANRFAESLPPNVKADPDEELPEDVLSNAEPLLWLKEPPNGEAGAESRLDEFAKENAEEVLEPLLELEKDKVALNEGWPKIPPLFVSAGDVESELEDEDEAEEKENVEDDELNKSLLG